MAKIMLFIVGKITNRSNKNVIPNELRPIEMFPVAKGISSQYEDLQKQEKSSTKEIQQYVEWCNNKNVAIV